MRAERVGWPETSDSVRAYLSGNKPSRCQTGSHGWVRPLWPTAPFGRSTALREGLRHVSRPPAEPTRCIQIALDRVQISHGARQESAFTFRSRPQAPGGSSPVGKDVMSALQSREPDRPGSPVTLLGDLHHERFVGAPCGYGESVNVLEDIDSGPWAAESSRLAWSASEWTRTRLSSVF